MFWECHIVSSSIDKLLDQSPDTVRLQDFLDENDLIQECLTQNKRLIDYLVQGDVMKELIEQLIKCPTDNNFHNAQVVSELLSGDFQRIQEALLQREHLDLLYSFVLIDNQSILNPILASYFARILTALIIRKPNEFLTYLKSRETFARDFFHHLYSTSITDVLYRLIADSGEQRSEAIEWYEEMNLIDGLMEQLLKADSIYVQMNIVNLLNEFLRLAFDQQNGIDSDFQGNMNISSSMMESFLYNGNENNNEESSLSKPFSTTNDSDNYSKTNEVEEKSTPLVLAQHILSKSNLEQLFDALCQQAKLVANGCDFLITILDLFGRYMPGPLCVPLISSSEENEQMQVNDEEDALPVIKSNETNVNLSKNLSSNAKNPLVRIYLILLEVIPSRLPSLIALLSIPSEPLISSNHDSSQTVKYQFISEPLGATRLNLIKFFSKLIYTISNDYTGDFIYQILDSNRFLHILMDLFYHHIYNNFLHTHVYLIIRIIFYINSIAVKQPNDIWTRAPLSDPPNSSIFHYTNRCSYRLFQTFLTSSGVNLIERLLDQYELNIVPDKSVLTSSSSDDAISSSLLHTRFASPNSGHIAQILRHLREHAPTFNNYLSFFKTDDQSEIDENTNALEIRWQNALEFLNEEEKKWAAMRHNERNNRNSFRMSSATNIMAQIMNAIKMNDSNESNQRRQTFLMRASGSSGMPYEEEDDNEMERLDIDDKLMNSEQTDNAHKGAEMKEIALDSQFPPVFDEQSYWNQQDHTERTKSQNDAEDHEDIKVNSASGAPDLFENYRMQPEKSASSTESSFEELCSLRANDHGGGPVNSSFQSPPTVQDEVSEGPEEF